MHASLGDAKANGPAPARRYRGKVAYLYRELKLARRAARVVVLQLSHLHPPDIVLRQGVGFITDWIADCQHAGQIASARKFDALSFDERYRIAERARAGCISGGDLVGVGINRTIDRAID